MTIPFFSFKAMHNPIKIEILNVFEQFYEDAWYVLGNGVSDFESQFADYSATEHCVGVSNGLDAITLSLKALSIGNGDEVIVPSNTYIATVIAVISAGAKPIFVEPREASFNINPDLIRTKISSRTKAIIPVHLFGQAAEMVAIMSIAKEFNLFVIEDNAQSQGATVNGKMTGSFGDCNATSFYPAKNLGALGDAGAITTNNESLASRVKLLRNYGSSKKYYNEEIGYNMRLDELQARILSVKLPYLKKWNEQRQIIANHYLNELKGVDNLILPSTTENHTHVYHQFVIRTTRRDELQESLAKKGIGTLIHYPVPPHLQEACHFLNHKKNDFPIAENIADTSLSLPIYPGLTESQISYICEAITSTMKR